MGSFSTDSEESWAHIGEADPLDVKYIEKLQRHNQRRSMKNVRASERAVMERNSPIGSIKYDKPYSVKTQSVSSVHGINLKKLSSADMEKRLSAKEKPPALVYRPL